MFQKQAYKIRAVRASDSVALAALHQSVFFMGWDSQVFKDFLADPHYCGYIAYKGPSAAPSFIAGFVLARILAQEAEIISIAVNPKEQRKNLASRLLETLLYALHAQHLQAVFLEVDAQNKAAKALYKKFLFEEVGRRKAYYKTQNGRQDALVMCHRFVRGS